MITTNYKVTNTKTGASIVVNQDGFEGLIASHTSNMGKMIGALEAALIRSAVSADGWESQSRGMRIEQTKQDVNHTPVIS